MIFKITDDIFIIKQKQIIIFLSNNSFLLYRIFSILNTFFDIFFVDDELINYSLKDEKIRGKIFKG
jgi:hypothetical protein